MQDEHNAASGEQGMVEAVDIELAEELWTDAGGGHLLPDDWPEKIARHRQAALRAKGPGHDQ